MIHRFRLKSLWFVALLFPAFTFCQSAPPADRVRGWSADIDFLISEISKQHYIYRSRPLPETLTKQAEQLKRSISQYGDERMLLELQRLISLVGDGHSYVLPAGANRVRSTCLPVRFYLFSDGLYIIDAEPGYEKWIGSRVLSLGAVAPDVAMTRVGEMISQDNTMGTKWIGPFLLRFRGALEAVGVQLNAGKLSCTLEDSKGQNTETSFEFVSVPRLRGIPKLIPSRDAKAPPAPLYLSNVTSNYWFKELPEQHALYFQFNQVMNADNNPISAFAESLGNALTAKAPRLLVIDVRHNNGGNAFLLSPLMNVLKKFESNNPKSKIVCSPVATHFRRRRFSSPR